MLNRLSVWLLSVPLCLPSAASGQFYAGALGGLSTLSADARSVIGPQGASFSLYKPENGTGFSWGGMSRTTSAFRLITGGIATI